MSQLHSRFRSLLFGVILTVLLLSQIVYQLPNVSAAPTDNFAGTLLAPGVWTDSGANNGYTNQGGETNGGGFGCPTGVRSGWWQFTAPVTGSYVIDTDTSSTGVDTVLSVWNRTTVPNNNTGRLACDDDGGSGNQSEVTVNLTAGTTYQIRVASGNNVNGTYVLHINSAPTISTIANQTTPEDTAIGPIAFTVGDLVTPAGSLTLSATSSNGGLVNTGNIVFGGSGANRTVSITPTADQTGNTNITITVTDAGGASTSTTFQLSVTPVNDPPTISNIGNQTTNEDTAMGTVAFVVNDPEQTLGTGLTLSATSSNPALVPVVNITLNRILIAGFVNATPLANQNGTTTITITVTDPQGLTASDSFILTVNPVNDAPTNITLSNNTVAENVASGALVGSLTTTDVDIATNGDTHTYTLTASSVPGLFQIVGNQLQIANASLLNFETAPTVTITVRSTDTGGLFVNRNFTINVSDILETLSINDVSVVEGNTGTVTAQFTVTLANTSNQTITVNAATSNVNAVSGADYVALPSTLVTFAPGVTTQTVTVTVNGDYIDEVDETYNVNLSGVVNGIISDALGVGTIVDDDSAGVIVTPTTITVDEPNISQTYTVVLTSQPEPGEIVTVTGSSFNGAWITVSPTAPTFDDTNWNVPQTVTVTAIDNFLDDDTRTTTIAEGVTSSSVTTPYGSGTVTASSVVVTVNDDDVAGVIVTPTTVTVTENGPVQTYTVVLTSQPFPGETVTVATSGYNGVWIAVTPNVTFDASNWNVPQTVTVSAVDNFLDDDTRTTTITNTVTSNQATAYSGSVTAAPVDVTINDDDVASVTVTPTTITVTENGLAQTYTVVLTSQPFPGETVTITDSGFNAVWISVAPTTLTFDASNWNVPQTVTVTAVDNFLDDDTRTTTIANGVAGSDPLTRYGDGTVTAASVVVTVNDDDTAGVVVTPTTLTVSEPNTAQTYTVVLTSQPFPGETVTIATSGYSAAWITVARRR
ncbi:MAG: Calx-beta domain-containing protein [Anaerolineae bacterium]